MHLIALAFNAASAPCSCVVNELKDCRGASPMSAIMITTAFPEMPNVPWHCDARRHPQRLLHLDGDKASASRTRMMHRNDGQESTDAESVAVLRVGLGVGLGCGLACGLAARARRTANVRHCNIGAGSTGSCASWQSANEHPQDSKHVMHRMRDLRRLCLVQLVTRLNMHWQNEAVCSRSAGGHRPWHMALLAKCGLPSSNSVLHSAASANIHVGQITPRRKSQRVYWVSPAHGDALWGLV